MPSHDEHLLDEPRCACGSRIMYRRRIIDGETTFAAWCHENPNHVLPDALLMEIAVLRSELGS